MLRCYGRAGLQAMIREHVRLAALFEDWVLDEPGWEVCAPRPFSVVCFRRDGSDEENEALLERVNATGEMFISHTRLDGRYVLRLAIGNARTTEADVARAWEVLARMRAVIFDLWDTLALWPSEAFERRQARARASTSTTSTASGPRPTTSGRSDRSSAYFRGLGLDDERLPTCLRIRSRLHAGRARAARGRDRDARGARAPRLQARR